MLETKATAELAEPAETRVARRPASPADCRLQRPPENTKTSDAALVFSGGRCNRGRRVAAACDARAPMPFAFLFASVSSVSSVFVSSLRVPRVLRET